MSHRLCAALLMRVAMSANLGQALLFLVHAHGDELDHRLSDAETTLEFGDHSSVGLNGQQNVVAVVELANGVGELAAAQLFGLLDDAATTGDGAFEACNQ